MSPDFKVPFMDILNGHSLPTFSLPQGTRFSDRLRVVLAALTNAYYEGTTGTRLPAGISRMA
jgi:hypothetical protein